MNEIETAAGECLVVSGLPDRIPKHCSEVSCVGGVVDSTPNFYAEGRGFDSQKCQS